MLNILVLWYYKFADSVALKIAEFTTNIAIKKSVRTARFTRDHFPELMTEACFAHLEKYDNVN